MKRSLICLLAGALLWLLCACGVQDSQPEPPEPAAPVETAPEGQLPDTPDGPDMPEPQPDEPVQPVTRMLYQADAQAERLLAVQAEVADDSPAALADGLRELGVLPADAALLGCTHETLNGVQTLVLDWNEAFSSALRGCGSAGEWAILGSVVDTFLTAYPDCTQVLLTVEGETLETGHNVYDQPLVWYETEPEATVQLAVAEEDGQQLVTAVRKRSGLGFTIAVAEEGFTCQNEAECLSILSAQTLDTGSPAAYLSVTAPDLPPADAAAGLLQQSGDEQATSTDAFLGRLPATHISAEIPPYHTEYFVLESGGQTLLVEMGYADEALDTLLPLLVAMLNTFSPAS